MGRSSLEPSDAATTRRLVYRDPHRRKPRNAGRRKGVGRCRQRMRAARAQTHNDTSRRFGTSNRAVHPSIPGHWAPAIPAGVTDVSNVCACPPVIPAGNAGTQCTGTCDGHCRNPVHREVRCPMPEPSAQGSAMAIAGTQCIGMYMHNAGTQCIGTCDGHCLDNDLEKHA